MAIHTMCDESEATYSVPGYSGHERGTCRHGKTCPHYATARKCVSDDSYREEIRHDGIYADCVTEHPTLPDGRKDYSVRTCWGPQKALTMRVRYEGCVLETRERNYHDDSDFYALVWDESEQRVTECEYASTRGWTYPNHADPDATPEVLEKVRLWKLAQMRKAIAARIESPGHGDLEPGLECELKQAVRCRASVSEPCRKCNGQGYWQNPKRASDRRTCFGCNGAKVRKVAAPKGSPMVVHASGKRGKVIEVLSPFARYGSWRVTLQAIDGSLFTVPVNSLRLIMAAPVIDDDREPNLVSAYYYASGAPAGITHIV